MVPKHTSDDISSSCWKSYKSCPITFEIKFTPCNEHNRAFHECRASPKAELRSHPQQATSHLHTFERAVLSAWTTVLTPLSAFFVVIIIVIVILFFLLFSANSNPSSKCNSVSRKPLESVWKPSDSPSLINLTLLRDPDATGKTPGLLPTTESYCTVITCRPPLETLSSFGVTWAVCYDLNAWSIQCSPIIPLNQ